MKRYDDFEFDINKHQQKERRRENNAGGFKCSHCKRFVIINDVMGTANRNHCNWCLWSKHVDENRGDRRSECMGGMRPIGLTFKHEGYGKLGEIMLIHHCAACEKISINRIARDDPEHSIITIFNQSTKLNASVRARLIKDGINLLGNDDKRELNVQLFGK